MNSAQIKEALRDYYTCGIPAPDEAAKDSTIKLIESSAATQCRRSEPERVPFWRFVMGQLRFIPYSSWALQIAVLAVMFAIVLRFGTYDGSALVIMAAAVISVAVAIPAAFRSFECHVSELEYACMHDSMQVLASRLILFGLADVLWVTVAIFVIPSLSGIGALRIFLYAATPFFCFCAVCFYAARLTRGNPSVACVTAAVIAVLALWGVSTVLPQWYTNLSLLTWAAAFAVAVALAAYEAKRLFGQVAEGFVPKTPEISF